MAVMKRIHALPKKGSLILRGISPMTKAMLGWRFGRCVTSCRWRWSEEPSVSSWRNGRGEREFPWKRRTGSERVVAEIRFVLHCLTTWIHRALRSEGRWGRSERWWFQLPARWRRSSLKDQKMNTVSVPVEKRRITPQTVAPKQPVNWKMEKKMPLYSLAVSPKPVC